MAMRKKSEKRKRKSERPRKKRRAGLQESRLKKANHLKAGARRGKELTVVMKKTSPKVRY